ncbi:MAG: amidase [Myxococcales bacterium]|nr:amidase [Myxococcales bacterium]
MSNPIVFLSATTLAQRIRSGELTSTEAAQAYLRQIEAVNRTYNALVLVDAEAALERAREADAALARGEVWGPLHGVPVTVKDSLAVRGLRTTAGSPELADHVPPEDAALVALLREAGAVILGKTNLATLAMDMQTTNPVFGTTVNPWDEARTPGGSSGGCATALATGMTPLSFGSDLAGSIRVPSSFVGVYGLKPTFGVVSMVGHIPPRPGEVNGIRSLAVAGPLARSLEDLALALEVIAQPHRLDETPRPLRAVDVAPRDLASLRIAYARQLGDLTPSAEVLAAMDAFLARLRAAGATVVEATPPELSPVRAWETWGALVGMQGGYERSNFARWWARRFVGGAVREIPHLRRILDGHSVEAYMEALEEQQRQINAMEGFLHDYDAWIIPTSMTVAFEHRAPDRAFGDFHVYDAPMNVDGRAVPYYVVTQAFTTIPTVTESPVVTLPIGPGRSGLPVGVQVVGQRFQDRRLLQVAALLDQLTERPAFPLEPRAVGATPSAGSPAPRDRPRPGVRTW